MIPNDPWFQPGVYIKKRTAQLFIKLWADGETIGPNFRTILISSSNRWNYQMISMGWINQEIRTGKMEDVGFEEVNHPEFQRKIMKALFKQPQPKAWQ